MRPAWQAKCQTLTIFPNSACPLQAKAFAIEFDQHEIATDFSVHVMMAGVNFEL